MRSWLQRFRVLGLVTAAGLGLSSGFVGCASSESAAPVSTGSGGSQSGSGGATGTGGSGATGTGGSATGSGGSQSGSGGATGTGGSGGAADASVSDAGMDAPRSNPDANWMNYPGVEDLSTVKASAGCGKALPEGLTPNMYVQQEIDVPAVPLRGDGKRVFFIKLPADYSNTKPYRLAFIAPGCGGNGANPPFNYTPLAGADGVFQVGLQMEPGASQNGACFDDKRTDSIDYMYFERALDYMKANFCVDEHRVFVSGHSSGAWLSNQLGCVFSSRLIRAIGPASGGLATAASDGAGAAPPCKEFPTAGIWTHNENDTSNRIIGSQRAIERALRVNKCTNTMFNGPREPYAAPGAGMNCEKFSTCPAEFPIVLCHPATGGHPPPGFTAAATWQFFTSLP